MLRGLMLSLLLASGRSPSAEEITLPADPRAVMNAQKDCGAKGDGVADDTDALQLAIERSIENSVAYLPNGTYKVSRTLMFKAREKGGGEGAMVGPWIV